MVGGNVVVVVVVEYKLIPDNMVVLYESAD